MRPRLLLLAVLLGPVAISGCDQPAEQQLQAATATSAVNLSRGSPTSPDQEPVSEEEPITWLDDLEDQNAKEIEWNALIPEEWQPELLLDDSDIENLDDDDPRAQELLDKLKALWNEAPVVEDLQGQRIKLPGFVVPLEMNATKIEEFLLVPYFGACIHVPPPPANQIVHVVMRDGRFFEGAVFDTVWVTGTMQVERLTSDLGDAGYRLDDAKVVPYEIE